jgi:hypothetical protein
MDIIKYSGYAGVFYSPQIIVFRISKNPRFTLFRMPF